MMADSAELRQTRMMAAACVGAVLMALLALTACRRGMPVIDPSERPATADGTISGTVRGPEGTSSIVGRDVDVVNVDTGERHRVVTSNVGGFSVKVKPGKYRVDVALLPGESILKRPGVMQVNRSDVDAHADFIIGSGKASRRPAGTQSDASLAPPIA
jgi:hypothetical protein